MMRSSIIAFVYATIFVVFSNASYAQCCSVGAGFSSLPAALQNSALESGNFLAIGLNTNYTYFEDYYLNSNKVENGLTNEQQSVISSLSVIKSLYTDFLLHAELSYIPYFFQNNGNFNIDKSGISDFKANIGYSFFRDYNNYIFSQMTAGFKIPLEKESDEVISYERAYSVSLMSSTMKKFDELEALLSLVLRYEHFLSETDGKEPGDNYYSALVFTKILNNLTLSSEFSFLLKGKEDIEGEAYDKSGQRLIQFSPQAAYVFGNLITSLRYDLPIYKYYKNFQITPSYSISLNINYIY